MRFGRHAWMVTVSLLTVIALFFAYLRLTSTQPVNSDAAGNALEAWAMLHGNVLLRGWTLTDVSFYTTELPEYVLVEAVRGLRPDVMHICAALTYTLIVILAALVAAGASKGRVAIGAAAIAAVIIAVPQPGEATALVLSTPDHTGTTVPVLATLLLLDRAPRRWWTVVLTGVLLAWALIADSLVLVVAVAPLVIVCLLRVIAAVRVRREPVRVASYELALIAAAVVATGLASAAIHLIGSAGGWTVQPVPNQFVASNAMPGNTGLTLEGVLALFGADFFGMTMGTQALLALIHLAGVALVAAGLWLTLRRQLITGDLVAAAMAVSIVVNIAAYMVTFNMNGINTTREIAPVMGLGAALAGRVMAGRLAAPVWRPALAGGLACYLIAAVVAVAQATPAPANSQLTAWLERHNLRVGLAGYWDSSNVVLESRGAIQMGTLEANLDGLLTARHWENDARWFDPRGREATFVVTTPGGGPPSYITKSEALRTFGSPSATYLYGGRIIMVYTGNLLTRLAQPS